MNQTKNYIELYVVTPDGSLPVVCCDSVDFTVADNEKNKGGGRYTVKKGHVKSLMMLSDGELVARNDFQVIFSKKITSGIAQIKDNRVIITAIIKTE